MQANLGISNIVEHIVSGRVRQAVGLWKALRVDHRKCCPCFYSPLDVSIRCASCLETYFSHIELRRSHRGIEPEQLSLAQGSLSTWIESPVD